MPDATSRSRAARTRSRAGSSAPRRCERTSRSSASSASRPTNGVSTSGDNSSSRTSTSRQAGTGSVFPLSCERLERLGANGVADEAIRLRPSRTSSCPADCSRRAATFTASPVAKASCRAGSPTTTSPVSIPVRIARRAPHCSSSSSFSAASRSRSSSAARTARRASSSCTLGMPKTAMTASPMNFSTAPPCRPSTVLASSK